MSGSGVTHAGVTFQSWFRGLSLFYLYAHVHAERRHDLVQCRMEVSGPATCGHVAHAYRHDGLNYSIYLEYGIVHMCMYMSVDAAALADSRRVLVNVVTWSEILF